MAYSLVKDDDKNLITVTYEAETSYQDRVNLLNVLIVILKDEPTTNIIINTANAATVMTDDEQLEYGKLLAESSGYFQHNKTAIVKRQVNPHPYIIPGAYADGFRNIVEFDNEHDAIAWINGEIS